MNSTTYGVDEYGNEAEDIRSGYVGEFKKFGFSGVPKHCLACDGSEISRATYSELFEVFGETYGAGDGETTFNLPDFRGAFLRCIGGNAAALGVEQGDATRPIQSSVVHIRSIPTPADDAPVNKGALSWGAKDTSTDVSDPCAINTAPPAGECWYRDLHLDISRAVPTANENRPINYAVNICVVYE